MAFSVDPSHRPNGCFWPVISIPKGDDEAVLTDVHAVDQRGDQIERLERGRRLRRRLRDEPQTNRALAHPAGAHIHRQRVKAARVLARGDHRHLLDDPLIQRSVAAIAWKVGSETPSFPACTRGHRIRTFRPPSTTPGRRRPCTHHIARDLVR